MLLVVKGLIIIFVVVVLPFYKPQIALGFDYMLKHRLMEHIVNKLNFGRDELQ